MKTETEHRYGQFSIDDDFFTLNPEMVMAVMGRCIIHRAEHRFDVRRVEYSAWCPDFEIADRSCYPPKYKPIAMVDDETGSITVKFEKL